MTPAGTITQRWVPVGGIKLCALLSEDEDEDENEAAGADNTYTDRWPTGDSELRVAVFLTEKKK